MRVYVEKDYEAMSARAADIIEAEIIHNPSCVLGLATGTTPIGLYQKLIAAYKAGRVQFNQVKTVNLDEYVGIPSSDENSYHYFMEQNLFKGIDIKPANTHVPEGNGNLADACRKYEALLQQVGYADVQVLGIGRNGHIGFNEPAESFPATVHIVKLTDSTIQANARLFARKEDVPTSAITQGVADIMHARKILLLAEGEEKADAVYQMICGSVVPEVPASVLQLHPDVTIVTDEKAYQKVRENSL